MKSKQHILPAILITASGVILFSSKAVLIKLAYQYEVDSISLLLLRMLFSLPFFISIFLIRRSNWKENPITKKQFYTLIGLGFLGYYLASLFDFMGLTYITASLERLILFSYPTFVLLISRLFLKQKITKAQLISIIITYIGIAIIFIDKGGITEGSLSDLAKGSILVFLSAIAYASYLVGSGTLIEQVDSVRLTTYSMLVSCLAVVLHYLITTDINLFSFELEVYTYSFMMAVIATVIPSFLINEGVRRMGAPNVSIVGGLGPVSTIVLSMIFLGEALTPLQYAGAIVIIFGVVIIAQSKR
jgi:drug/metabolite transporter (DMT)-like permease